MLKTHSKRRGGGAKTVDQVDPIVRYSATGPIKKVMDLIKKGADVNAAYTKRSRSNPNVKLGSTALIEAVSHGQEEIANLLLKYGADVNREDESGHNALYYAVRREHTKLAKDLLRRGARLNDDVLCGPVSEGNAELTKLLIANGANLNCVFVCGREGRGNWPEGETLLGYAIRSISRVETTVQGKKVVVEYSPRIAELLIKAGADPDQPSDWLHLRNNVPAAGPIIPLRIAANKRLIHIMDLLWQAGANGTLQDALADATLERAVFNENMDIVKLLIKAGADVNERGVATGKLPVEIAREKGNSKILALLKKAGAIDQ